MKRTLLATLPLAFAGPLLAADAASGFIDHKTSYRSKNGNGEEIRLTLPYIDGANKQAARRMNVLIHDKTLATLPDDTPNARSPRQVLLDPPLDTLESQGIQAMNAGRTLTAQVYAEGCGAYCSSSTSAYHFDARNGRLIVKQEVVTPAGQLALGKQMLAYARTRLKTEIARLEKQIAMGKRSKDRSLADMQDQLSMYENCLENRFDADSGKRSGYLKDPGAMSLGNGALSFFHGKCASHSADAIDDLGDFTLVVKAQALRPHLTAYGKYLLLGEGDGRVAPVNPYSQYFKGTINGSIPVTLYLGAALGGETPLSEAHYYYDRYKKKISLSVKRTGNRFELTELDSPDAVKPVLRVELQGDRLTGQWSGGGKSHAFEAQAL